MQKNTLAVCSFITLFSISFIYSIPYHKTPFQLRQPDGALVDVLITGDEIYQDVETPDGYTLLRDSSGWICYARLSEDSARYLSTGFRYRDHTLSNGRHAGEKGLRIAHRSILAARSALSARTIDGVNGYNAAPAGNDIVAAARRSVGYDTVVSLTLCVEFADVKSTMTRHEIDRFCNGENYHEFGNNGSVREYFNDVSGGKFTYRSVVSEMITLSREKSWYDSPNHGIFRVYALIQEAFTLLRDQGFDLSSVTKEGGAFVAVNILYAGMPESGWSQGLWPHCGTVLGSISAQGIQVRCYQLSNMGNRLSLGTFVHENGHMLFNWPDLYAYDGHSSGIGKYCVMGYVDDTDPQVPNPYFRALQGWVKVLDMSRISGGTTVMLTSNSDTCYRFGSPSSREFYYVEARTNGGPRGVIPDEGIAVWHINLTGSNLYSYREDFIALEQADGHNDLELKKNFGDSGDLFTRNNGSIFNDRTIPSALWLSGRSSNLYLCNIGEPGRVMSLSIGSFRAPTLKVVGGGGSGLYAKGDTVRLHAGDLDKRLFAGWRGDTDIIRDSRSESVVFTMPDRNISLEAVYDDSVIIPSTASAVVSNRRENFQLSIVAGSIEYRIADRIVPSMVDVSLKLYTLDGRLVRILVAGKQKPGVYTIQIKKTTHLVPQMVICRMVAGSFSRSIKIVAF